MFSLNLAAAAIAVSTLSVSGLVIPRTATPSNYNTSILEPYMTYHERYLALGCQYNHGNDFFAACCHPLKIGEDLSSREARCTPDAGVLSSISASLTGQTSTVPAAAAPTTTDSASSVDVAENLAVPSSTWSSAAASSTSASSNVQTGGFGTFFYQNGVAGACGTVHGDYDYVLAMDSAIYSQDLCGKSVTITNTANQKTVTAVVADECPTCNNAQSIDMSLGAFLQLADESVGLIDITWSYD